VKFLSTRRRHPLAGLVVVLLGLVVTAALYSAFRPAVASQSGKTDSELIAQGRKLFTVGCSSCHGLNGEGVVTKGDSDYGPPLIGVGAAAVDFQVGTGRMPFQQPGTQAPVKPKTYSDDEVSALAAYVASLGPGPAIPSDADLDTSNASVSRGMEFFLANCSACHNFAGQGGALRSGRTAPNLMDSSARHIYEAMITGPQQMPVFADSVIRPQDKQDLIAFVQSLQNQTSYGGSALGSRGPVTEGLFGWLFGIGSLVLVTVWIANNGARAGKKKQG
jgi:ubiquinol-cytochrome c reductase cytochrome c subunit